LSINDARLTNCVAHTELRDRGSFLVNWLPPIPYNRSRSQLPFLSPLLVLDGDAHDLELPCVGAARSQLHGRGVSSLPFLPHLRPFPSTSWRRSGTACNAVWRCRRDPLTRQRGWGEVAAVVARSRVSEEGTTRSDRAGDYDDNCEISFLE
jgi:hypothetical protein